MYSIVLISIVKLWFELYHSQCRSVFAVVSTAYFFSSVSWLCSGCPVGVVVSVMATALEISKFIARQGFEFCLSVKTAAYRDVNVGTLLVSLRPPLHER